MNDRELSTVSGLIANINQRLDDLKTSQPFGGDALTVNEYEHQLANDNTVVYHLKLTPTNTRLGVLPSKLELRWTNTNDQSQAVTNFTVTQGYPNDGSFLWVINGGHSNNFDTYVTLQYIGPGTVTLTRVA